MYPWVVGIVHMHVGARGIRPFGDKLTGSFKLPNVDALTELWSSGRVMYVGS